MSKNIRDIAADVLDIPTLDTRNSDELDFYDLSVWQIKAALEQAHYQGTLLGRAEMHVSTHNNKQRG